MGESGPLSPTHFRPSEGANGVVWRLSNKGGGHSRLQDGLCAVCVQISGMSRDRSFVRADPRMQAITIAAHETEQRSVAQRKDGKLFRIVGVFAGCFEQYS